MLGVIRFDGRGADRRGQAIPAGLYTLRYAHMPANDSHLSAAPQRDFLLLVAAADDPNPESTPKLDGLLALSRKASGTGHPAVFSIWKASAEAAGFSQRGDDWVLETTVGTTPIAVIVIGTAAS